MSDVTIETAHWPGAREKSGWINKPVSHCPSRDDTWQTARAFCYTLPSKLIAYKWEITLNSVLMCFGSYSSSLNPFSENK